LNPHDDDRIPPWDRDLDELARHVIDTTAYMVLGTIEPDGSPRVSPVYFGVDRYRDFYWISSPESHHSLNVAERDRVSMVVFGSEAVVGAGRAVYVSGRARQIAEHELADRCDVAFRTIGGGRAFAPHELSGDQPFRLYVLSAETWEVHIPGRHPVWGTGIDRRVPANPAAIE
jgi:nitroimidazol reductase NimA-like FMN-containing flavoprotein (pyridoxamine 5'-phosphate oxidase superfamily)